MMSMNKKDCMIIGLSAMLATGMTIGYISMDKKKKKSKLNINSLDY